MMEPVRPNTEVTGTDTAAGVSQTGSPPDIERISPLAPVVRLIVFPTRVRPLLNVRILSLVATTHERDERLDSVVEILPERVAMLPVAVARLEFVVLRFVVSVAMLPDNVVIFDVFVAMLPVAVLRFVFVVLRFVVRVAMFPVAVLRFVFVVAIEPVIAATVPERAFCALRLVK